MNLCPSTLPAPPPVPVWSPIHDELKVFFDEDVSQELAKVLERALPNAVRVRLVPWKVALAAMQVVILGAGLSISPEDAERAAARALMAWEFAGWRVRPSVVEMWTSMMRRGMPPYVAARWCTS